MILYLITLTSVGASAVISLMGSTHNPGPDDRNCHALPLFTSSVMVLVSIFYYLGSKAFNNLISMIVSFIARRRISRRGGAMMTTTSSGGGDHVRLVDLKPSSDHHPDGGLGEFEIEEARSRVGPVKTVLAGDEEGGGDANNNTDSHPPRISDSTIEEGNASMAASSSEEEYNDIIASSSSLPPSPCDIRDRRDGNNNTLFDSKKIWRNVYGLGVGTFCMSYCMQMPSRQCNTFLCATMWFVSIHQDFAVSHGHRRRRQGSISNNAAKPSWKSRDTHTRAVSYYHGAARADCYNYILRPGMIGIYGVISILMFVNMPIPHSVEFAIINTAIPIVAPIAMRYVVTTPKMKIGETIELGSPVAALLSMCVICTFVSSQSECVSHRFMGPPSNHRDAEEGDSTITSMMMKGIMNSTLPVSVYPLPVISTLLAPVAGICTLVSTTTSYTTGRSFDVAVIFLIVSIAVECWIHFSPRGEDDHEYSSSINFIHDPGTIKRGIISAEIILSSIVAVSLIVYRFKVGKNNNNVDDGDAAGVPPNDAAWEEKVPR